MCVCVSVCVRYIENNTHMLAIYIISCNVVNIFHMIFMYVYSHGFCTYSLQIR